MKRLIITQYGREEIEHARTFCLEVPDDFPVDDLDEWQDAIDQLANDLDIAWETEDSTGIDSDRIDVEYENASEDQAAGFRVVALKEDVANVGENVAQRS